MKSGSCTWWSWVALAVVAPIAAQERGHAELQVMQRQLQTSRTETERLLQMRMRQDLGLPGDERDDRTFRSTGPVTSEQREKMEQQRADEESAVAVLNVEYEKLRNAVDQLRAAGLAVFGPGREGALLEASKGWAKQLMREAGVPTAGYWQAGDGATALAALEAE